MKNKIINFMMVTLTFILLISVVSLIHFSKSIFNDISVNDKVDDLVIQCDDSEDYWDELFKINDDFYALLEFEEGLIIEPVVQTTDNEYYVNHSFDGSESTQGTLFVDSNYSLDDNVKIIYGHNVYYDQSAMFSPLQNLYDQASYEDNIYFYLKYKTHQDIYKIFGCIEYDIYCNEFNYQIDKFDDSKMFDEWIGYILKNNEIVPIEDHYSVNDEYVLLQTCKKWNDDVRLLIVAKKI